MAPGSTLAVGAFGEGAIAIVTFRGCSFSRGRGDGDASCGVSCGKTRPLHCRNDDSSCAADLDKFSVVPAPTVLSIAQFALGSSLRPARASFADEGAFIDNEIGSPSSTGLQSTIGVALDRIDGATSSQMVTTAGAVRVIGRIEYCGACGACGSFAPAAVAGAGSADLDRSASCIWLC